MTFAMVRKLGLSVLAGAFATLLALGAVAAPSATPQLYFYPPPIKTADGSLTASVPSLSVEQITTQFPAVPEMAGVSMIVNWSQLCPAGPKCDLSMIDQVLHYWSDRGKKVILAVATVGFPYKVMRGTEAYYQSATPDWVLDQVNTYSAPVKGFGRIHNSLDTVARFPSYADPRFTRLITQLVQQLSRLDGNPAIAEIRISTGLLTEDNPSPAGPRWLIPNYTDLDWIQYCEQMVSIYYSNFHKSQLEFDLGFVSLAYARGGTAEKRGADQLMDRMIQHHIFLAYDGLRSSTIGDAAPNMQSRDGVSRSLYYLMDAQQHGCEIGLEGGPLSAAFMQDVDAIAKTIRLIKPTRLVLWATEAATLNDERYGHNQSNASTLEWLAAQPTAAVESAHLHRLLQAVGF